MNDSSCPLGEQRRLDIPLCLPMHSGRCLRTIPGFGEFETSGLYMNAREGNLGCHSCSMNLPRHTPQSGLQVKARSLFPYIAHPGYPYRDWVQSLTWRHPFVDVELDNHLSITSDGEVFISPEYAKVCLYQNVPDIVTAIGVLLVEEALRGKYGDAPDCVTRTLDVHLPIARTYGLIRTSLLHAFLGIDMDHDHWMDGLKKKHKMRFKADYNWVVSDQGEKKTFFMPLFAKKVAREVQTPRGRFLDSFFKANEESFGSWNR